MINLICIDRARRLGLLPLAQEDEGGPEAKVDDGRQEQEPRHHPDAPGLQLRQPSLPVPQVLEARKGKGSFINIFA